MTSAPDRDRGAGPTDEVSEDVLPAVFARTVRRHADRVAVDVPPGDGRPARTTWTYARLDAAAARLAAALAPWAGADRVVAIHLPRHDPTLFAAQLAVSRAGAAWTCVDASFPEDHLAHVLADAKAVAVLTDAAGAARPAVAGSGVAVLDVASLLSDAAPAAASAPRGTGPRPSSLAYVIYTSGTTGRPKGVAIEQRSIVNLVRGDLAAFGLGPGDRVAQGSSAAYDSSVEESWLAFASGATLVVLDDTTARLGPDLVPFLREEGVTVFCPPPTQLRATGCEDPRAALPRLRLLYVGGEALTPDVVERWAPGRRLVNGYGPTETTVTSLRGDVVAGGPVTIGRPVPGLEAFVLDERLEPVPDGEPGELFLGGAGLARGYLGNDDLTAERFPTHPRLGRLYRTGDLVRRDGGGDHHYLGRIDAQVKLRGHRIELSAVEAVIAACPGVRAVGCRVQGSGAAELLAAHVVPTDPAAPPRVDELEAAVRARLPSAAVPGRWAWRDALPQNRSGKLDRAALPELAAPARHGARAHVAPRDAQERRVAAAVRSVLALDADVSVEDDFFLDLGGTSLSAAVVVSTLRRDPASAAAAVRDVYEGRTVAGIARRIGAGRPVAASAAGGAPGPAPVPAAASVGTAAVQTLWLLAGLVLSSAAVAWVWLVLAPAALARFGIAGTMLLAPLAALLLQLVWFPGSVLVVAAAKRVLVGRYRPMRAPAEGGFALRHWLVTSLARAIPWSWVSDTVLVGVALRALGARVGARVHVHQGVDLTRGGWDLLTLGDDASLGMESSVRLVEVEAGQLVVGPVTLGRGATLDVRAGAGADTELGDGAYLGPLSSLAPGARVPAGEAWAGVPASRVGDAPRPVVDGGARAMSPAAHAVLTLALRFLRPVVGAYGALVAVVAWWCARSGFDGDALIALLAHPTPSATVGALALLYAASVPVGLVAAAVGLRLVGRVRPGTWSRWSVAYLRILAKTETVRRAGDLLAGTMLWPLWLKMAGMRAGRRCEVSTVEEVVPELVEVGGGSFLTDGIYLGPPRVVAGTVTVAATRLGARSFVGNHVVVPPGTQLPDEVLLGVSTLADGRMPAGTSWFGHPAFELPRREVVVADERLTHRPGFLRWTTRLLWELARFLIPAGNAAVLLAWAAGLSAAATAWHGPALWFVAAPTLGFLAAAVPCAWVVAAKWLLLGRVRPGQRGFWSCWASRWDFHYVLWQEHARRALSHLEGTPWLAWYLRAMGCRIGRGVTLGPGFAQVVDPDMFDLEDGVTMNAYVQAHSFEDRVLKLDRVHVRRGATVGSQALLLYGADVGEGTTVAPHSVVMKHERLLPGRAYAGVPTQATG